MKKIKMPQYLKGIALVILVGAIAGCSTKNDSNTTSDAATTADSGVEFLLVQNADGVTLSDGLLRLKGIAATTLYFSDRPDRIVGRVTTQEYVDHWAVGDNNFSSDPPNAVLSILSGSEPQNVVVVLTQPRLEGDDLLYNVEVLNGNETVDGGASSLFIDVVGRPLTPLSVAGVARRSARRTVRRNIY